MQVATLVGLSLGRENFRLSAIRPGTAFETAEAGNPPTAPLHRRFVCFTWELVVIIDLIGFSSALHISISKAHC